jgi:acid phosphatase (class A)
MKRTTLTILFIASILFAHAQRTAFAPARGHYKQLKQLSTKPEGENLEIDKQQFPFEAATAERRLSLKPYYLTDKVEFNIPNPPANSSEQTRAELNYLLGLQQTRTPEQEKAALHMAGIYYNVRTIPTDSTYAAYRKNLFHIGHSIGTWFNPDNLPVTANFMAHVWQDASYYIWKYKYKFLRVRPYVLEPALQNLEETNWAAYPSGHSANSYINAFVYAMLAPEFTDVFLKDAYDMAHSREIIGVHYPSDSEVSRELANQLVKALLENEKFKKDFEEVKKEWSLKAKESFEKPLLTPKTDKKKESCAKTCE